MTPHHDDVLNLVAELSSNQLTGLTTRQAEEKLQQAGPNQLKAKKKKSLLARFLGQFADPMIIILLAAAVISFVVALNGHDANEFFEPILILLIVVANAIMGVSQESKAEKALDALKELSAPHARVLRDGTVQMVDSAVVVPGDVVLIAGKGHETSQLIGGATLPFDDRREARAALERRRGAKRPEGVR